MANIGAYIIDHTDVAWSDILAGWAWLLPSTFTVWLMNRFGDLFLVFDDGSVHWLDVGVGELRRLADSRDHFADLLDQDDNASDWLMMPLVDELLSAGLNLRVGECYSYVRLPILGGDYTVSNTRVVPIEEHFTAFGPVQERLKDLPDGTGVILKGGAV